MAVKGKGKQLAADAPGGSGSGSGSKRRAGDAAGPSSSRRKVAAKRGRRPGVLQFFDDVADEDDEYEEEEVEVEDGSEEDLDDDAGFVAEDKRKTDYNRRTERSHPLPFLGHVKEEELSGDELEEFIKQRYSRPVRYAGYGGSTQYADDDADDEWTEVNKPVIWRVKCMVGRERQMAFCLMQKFVDLEKFGTKVPIISAFSLDHVRGFVFVEAEKVCDVTEACKGFCNVYVNRSSSVPAADVPSLLSPRAKPCGVSPGTWVRVKAGNYKGDLAQVVAADDGRKRVLIKLIPRVDLQAIAKKFGGATSLKDAAVPAPRLISSQELELFGPHIERRRDRQTGDIFEVLDSLMFKDGFLHKRVALSSLIYWGIQPTDTELVKFSSSPSTKSSADDMDWVSSVYGHKKRNMPRECDMKTSSSSKGKCSKALNLKGSSSAENYDDDGDGDGDGDGDEFHLHDLVLFGRKDFGVIIAVEKDGFKILKGGPEGSAVTVRKQDIKKGCVDTMFTAFDHQKKTISINDSVKVLEGPAQGKQGVVKHLYMGILFLYDESESENSGYFCAQCGSCENMKKKRELENSEDNPIPMFSDSGFVPSEQNEQRSNERSYRAPREQLFQIGEMLRIRKGPLKGYLCRVIRIFRNDVTVKLDSLLKIVTVQAELLSVPTKRGDNSSSGPSGSFGTQDTPFFGSEAGKTSWGNGLTSLGSDSWQPSSSAVPAQNADGEAEVDPWCKKPASADGDSDPWCKKPTSADGASDPWGKTTTPAASEIWSNITTQKENSSDNAWGKPAGGSGFDSGGSSWGGAAVNKDSEKSDNWGEACKAVDMATGGDTDPWGSKVKLVKEADNWENLPGPPEKSEDGQGWGQPFGKSSQDQEKGAGSKDTGKSGSWDTAVATRVGSDDDAWAKSDALPVAQDDAWGKSKDNNGDQAVEWNKVGSSDQLGGSDWSKPNLSGGAGTSSWNKGETVGGDNQNSSWSKPAGNFEGGRGFGQGRGRGRGRESSDLGGRNDQESWKGSWGNDSSAKPSWGSDTQVDNEGGDSGRYRGRGRGRGQYGGRGRGRDSGWRNGDGGGSEFGREKSSGDTPNWGNSQHWSGSESTKTRDENQTSTWNCSEDKKLSGGEQDDPWGSKVVTEGQEQQNDAWSSKVTSTTGAENNDGWNTKAKESSCSLGSKSENAASGEEGQADPWSSKIVSTAKGKEQESDPWASKISSTAAEKKADTWGSGNGGSWNSSGSSVGHQESSWGKPSSSSGGDQEPAWNKPNYGDDNSGSGRGGFGRGNRGRGRGRFGDSSWNGGSNINDESGGGRSEGGRGRGRGRFGRGDRNEGNNNFGSGDRDGGSWGSGRGNRGRGGGYRNWNENNEGRASSQERGGGWSQSTDWNAGKKGSAEGNQAFSQGNSSWGSGNNDSWGAPKPSGGDDQAGKKDGNNAWSQNKPSSGSGSSILGQWGGKPTTGGGGSVGGGSWGKSNEEKSSWGSDKNDSWGAPKPSGGDDQTGKKDGDNSWSQNKPSSGGGSSILGQWRAPPSNTTTGTGGPAGGGGSWGKSNEDGWNSSKGTGGSGGDKKEGSWDKADGSGSQGGGGGGSSWDMAEGSGSQGGGGGGSSWDKADGGGWNSSKGADAGSGGGGW